MEEAATKLELKAQRVISYRNSSMCMDRIISRERFTELVSRVFCNT